MMQEAMAMDKGMSTATVAGPSMAQMPLTFMKSGEMGTVVKVREKGDVLHHLENLGFVAGAEVKVVSGAGRQLHRRGQRCAGRAE